MMPLELTAEKGCQVVGLPYQFYHLLMKREYCMNNATLLDFVRTQNTISYRK